MNRWRWVVGMALGFPALALLGQQVGPPAPAPILNAPFSGTRVLTHAGQDPSGKPIQVSVTYYEARDSQGRTYERWQPIDMRDQRHKLPINWFAIYDPATRTRSMWCDSCKQLTEYKYGEPRTNTSTASQAPNPERPTKMMLGVQVEERHGKTNFRHERNGVMTERSVDEDLWYSVELHLALEQNIHDTERGEVHAVYTELKREEPSDKLFRLPKGKAIVEGKIGTEAEEQQRGGADYN